VVKHLGDLQNEETMAIKLTWDDLLIQDYTSEQARQWLDGWTWLATGDVMPLALSRFGNWFLLRRDGRVEMLNVLDGILEEVAKSRDQFYALINDRTWQEENLLSLMIYQLHEEGKIPGQAQCYGFAPHPRLTGCINRNQVMILSIAVWQTICAQVCQQTSS
jgi:hypothetical protein